MYRLPIIAIFSILLWLASAFAEYSLPIEGKVIHYSVSEYKIMGEQYIFILDASKVTNDIKNKLKVTGLEVKIKIPYSWIKKIDHRKKKAK